MPIKTLHSFDIKRIEVLDVDGNIDEALMPQLSNDQIKNMYWYMVLARAADFKAVNLQRQGRMGTYAPVWGQEAAQVGSASVLTKDDWLVPAFRESAAYLVRGMPVEATYRYWGGDERGSKIPEGINTLPVSVPVGSHPLHAVGIAWAAKIQHKNIAVLTYFGDGATSEGDLLEAMNFAGVFKAPCVFLCQNNQWAISVPVSQQTASETLAQKAIAFGFEGIQVDGNDLFAVFKATKDAVEKAKQGLGPTFIECVTYRMGDHTTADDASRYRTQQEIDAWKLKDPIDRVKKFMMKKGFWSESEDQALQAKAVAQVEEAVKTYENTPLDSPSAIFNFMYAEKPWQLKEEEDELLEEVGPAAEVKGGADK